MSIIQKKAASLTTKKSDLDTAAFMIFKGKILGIPFNGIYGIFGDADDPKVQEKILRVKGRNSDQNLILTADPRHLHEHIDFRKAHYSQEQIIKLQTSVHALGVILPASKKAPQHLVKDGTILNIWTEYTPIIYLIKQFRKLGGRDLVGTSANKHGGPTIHDTNLLWNTFGNDLDGIVQANHSKYADQLKQSTTVIKLTSLEPVLHRLGSVSISDLKIALKIAGIKQPLRVDKEKVIHVKKK